MFAWRIFSDATFFMHFKTIYLDVGRAIKAKRHGKKLTLKSRELWHNRIKLVAILLSNQVPSPSKEKAKTLWFFVRMDDAINSWNAANTKIAIIAENHCILSRKLKVFCVTRKSDFTNRFCTEINHDSSQKIVNVSPLLSGTQINHRYAYSLSYRPIKITKTIVGTS